ncbi:Ribosomal protein S18 acetylase RimI [Rhizobium sp. RU20A]|uniref:GNAT family N-acetyltransferase n=1 Tax=Rhizobium sp. RU20A TaxID=1907412 RepID=UPI0009560614|nr:GNAT family N-acetyltransferase [Rhizobium sp. RU20A]SIR46193.1 Ribosomal protein S18 acetylase RimI [Rhizobium sp. RU20A]
MAPGAERGRVDLPMVRRLEAVGFRSWPAASVHYDGSWLVRLTAGHGSKRLNSVNPLDPSDHRDLAARLSRASTRFAEYGRPLTVRQTPLCSPQLSAYLDGEGWTRLDESIVMAMDLPAATHPGQVEHLPVKDLARFVDARLAICNEDARSKAGLSEVINAIRSETGLFLFEEPDGTPSAVALAVQDNDLCGLHQIAVAPAHRRQGLGRNILAAALRWAALKGAQKAWLAVEADNAPALALYRDFGFAEVYRYVYRRPGDAA